MRTSKPLLCCLVVAFASISLSQIEASLVVPGANELVEGSYDNGYPFNLDFFSRSSMRYQQAYGASEFGSSPVLITQILFRPDGNFGSAFNTILPSVQINLSTTSQAIDGLSSVFANNVGSDDTVVLSQGPLSLSSSDSPGPGNTRAFDIVINLDTAFLYDPSQGNLLLDVRNFGAGSTTQFDAVFANDSVSRGYYGNVNAPSGTTDTAGLVTAFTTDSVIPEPTTIFVWSLLGLTAGGICYKRRRSSAL